MFTEAEAKTKWCPFARAEHDALAVNRAGGDFDAQGNEAVVLYGRWRCIASRCMAWRWTTEPLNTKHREETGRGVCGLAGKITP